MVGGGGPGEDYVTIDFIWLKVNDISKDFTFYNRATDYTLYEQTII